MIRFFQKIRRKLVAEDRFRKYALYAFGEIILIVIGILIALQIDTWNTHKNEIDGLIKSFEQIEESLVVDLSHINEVIKYHKTASESAKSAKDHLEERKEWTIQLSEWISDADNLKIYTPQSSTFEAIKLNGIELIENTLLKNQLIRVYEELTEDHKRRESIIEYIRNDYYNVWETRNLDRKNYNSHWTVRDYNAVLNDYEFHGNLLVLINRHRSLVETGTNLASEIKSLKKHIHDEIIRLKKGGELSEENKSIAFKEPGMILKNGRFKLGVDFGYDSYPKAENWVSTQDDTFCMSYPSERDWGVVFITVGRPSNPPRQHEDFSKYKKLFIEMKGELGGEKVEIALKDKDDLDDGSEDKFPITLTKQWKTYEIDIATNFGSATLEELYIITQFVFGPESQNICVRKLFFE